MAKMIHSDQSFINVEEAIIAKKRKKTERVEVGYPEQSPCPKKVKTKEKIDLVGRKLGSSLRRYSNYTPLNAPFDQVMIQIKDGPSLKWPEKMKEDPSKRNKSKYYRFHQDHRHDMDECYNLK